MGSGIRIKEGGAVAVALVNAPFVTEVVVSRDQKRRVKILCGLLLSQSALRTKSPKLLTILISRDCKFATCALTT